MSDQLWEAVLIGCWVITAAIAVAVIAMWIDYWRDDDQETRR